MNGDIDLTKNLDFYREKPEKLLPANVQLSRPIKKKYELTENKLTIDNTNLTNIISDSYVRTISNNNTLTYYWSYDNDDLMYTNDSIHSSYEYSNNYSISTTSSSGNNINITFTYDNSLYFSWTDYHSDLYSYKKTNETKRNISANNFIEEKGVNLPWKKTKNRRTPVGLIICKCKNCGEPILLSGENNRYSIHYCRECERKNNASCGMEKYINFNGRRRYGGCLKFSSRNDDNYHGTPWSQRKAQKTKSHWYTQTNRLPIPWLQKLSDRLYRYYIAELKGEDENLDSYLTNMSWIGIRSNDVNRGINTINIVDSNTNTILSSNNEEELEVGWYYDVLL